MKVSDRVRITIIDGVADVVLTRPEKRNAFDDEMFAAITDASAALATDTSVQVVVLSGEGPCFSAGLDTSKFGGMVNGDVQGGERILGMERGANGANRGQQVSMGWRAVPVPVIAAVHGVALGAGFQLALGADLRFVSPDARLSAFEINWGLVPDMGAFVLLRELLKADVARDLVFSGRMVSGQEALQIGLATRLCDDPRAEALAYARELTGKNPDALKAAKRIFNMAVDSNVSTMLEAESKEMAALMGAPNQLEAVRARLEKRTAHFR